MPSTRIIVSTWLALPLLAFPSIATAAAPNWRSYDQKPDAWFRSPEGETVVANVLANQSPKGCWPKNVDTTTTLGTEPAKIQGTFDNGATVGEARFLARAFRVTANEACRDAVLRTIDTILEAQYPTGGWPQTYPPGPNYPRYITYNDGTMVTLMTLLREVIASEAFAFVDDHRRSLAERAFAAGVRCILASQVVVDGKKTVWCAQHDEVTLAPRPARTYELVSLSGSESAGVLTLLMSLEKPSAEVVGAIDGGAAWFEKVKLTGIRQAVVNGDKRIVSDPTAPPLWARFYEIGTNTPFFSGRDGIKKYDISEIEAERRNGYAWYGTWGSGLLERYARWKEKQAKGADAGPEE